MSEIWFYVCKEVMTNCYSDVTFRILPFPASRTVIPQTPMRQIHWLLLQWHEWIPCGTEYFDMEWQLGRGAIMRDILTVLGNTCPTEGYLKVGTLNSWSGNFGRWSVGHAKMRNVSNRQIQAT